MNLKIAFEYTDKSQINCTGQTAATQCLSNSIPNALTRSGHINFKPTLQVADPAFPKIYAVSDVAELGQN